MRARKTSTWEQIEQPGDFYRVVGGYVIQDAGDYDVHWRILQDVPGGLYCERERESY